MVISSATASAERKRYLVLPLGRHDLGVDARDVDAGEVAGLQVRLHDVASNGCAGASRAVVWALWAREPALGPAQGPLGCGVQQGVLLWQGRSGCQLNVR